MREAPAIYDHRGPAARGRQGHGVRSGSARTTARVSSDDRIALCDKSYDALAGADALAIVTEWNEFREPDFDEDAPAAARARRLRRPQHLLARADAGARLHVFLHWPLTDAPSSSPAAPATSAATPQRRCTRPATTSSSTTTSSPATAEAVKYGDLVEGDITDVDAVRARAQTPRHLRRDALRGVPRRRRVGSRADRVTTATTSAVR